MVSQARVTSRAERMIGVCGLFLIGLVGVAADRIAKDEAAGRRRTAGGYAALAVIGCIASVGRLIDWLTGAHDGGHRAACAREESTH